MTFNIIDNNMYLWAVSLVVGGAMAVFSGWAVMLFHKHRSMFSGPGLPPGRIGFPVIGETMEFLSTGWKGRPEKFIFDRMGEHSSEVFKTSLVGEPAAVFCGAACNKFLFSNENKLVAVWWPSSVNKVFPASNLTNAQEEAKKMRRLLPAFMKPEALHRYVPIMDTIARRCFAEGWEGRDQVKVFPLAKRYTFWLAARVFLSMDDPLQVAALEVPFGHIAAGIISMPLDLPGTPFRRAIRASEFVRGELAKIIKQRRNETEAAVKKADILSHMLETCTAEGVKMSDADVADKILGLLIGGHDTASAACTFVMKYLAEYPEVYEAVYAEQMSVLAEKERQGRDTLDWEDLRSMKYSWNVAQEVLRVAPPLQGAFREVLTEFVFQGFRIPKGWKLYWSANSTHKSDKYFPEPERFDPSRFEGKGPAPYTFVPFGGGPRMCPGKEYARLEILVFIHNLVTRFRWQKVLPEEGIVVDPLPIPVHGLPVRLFPHPPTTA